jgi:hypothetical protein
MAIIEIIEINIGSGLGGLTSANYLSFASADDKFLSQLTISVPKSEKLAEKIFHVMLKGQELIFLNKAQGYKPLKTA